MTTKIYNLDLIERKQSKVKIKNKLYTIQEPTVYQFSRITQFNLDEVNGQDKMLKLLCPEIFKKKWGFKTVFENLTIQQKKLLIEACFKVVTGEKSEEGKKTLQDIVMIN